MVNRERKRRERQRRYNQLNAEFQRITRVDKNTFLSEECKEIEERIE